MKILLVSVNASYMHTNIAIRDLKNYADKTFENAVTRPEIELAEFTINQPIGEVLRGIAFSGADWIQFSTYIWNAEYVTKLLPEIKKVLPLCILGAGGPEFGYGAKKYLSSISDLDFVVFGEGELTFCDMIEKSGGEATHGRKLNSLGTVPLSRTWTTFLFLTRKFFRARLILTTKSIITSRAEDVLSAVRIVFRP